MYNNHSNIDHNTLVQKYEALLKRKHQLEELIEKNSRELNNINNELYYLEKELALY